MNEERNYLRMKTLKILSIDMDFFQDVSADTVAQYYPDGYDAEPGLSTVIWSHRYAHPEFEKVKDSITCPKDKFNLLVDGVLSSQKAAVPVQIAQSHKHAYSFIASLLATHSNLLNIDPNDIHLELVNIDMHHDMFVSDSTFAANDNDILIHCGNWVNHIFKMHSNTEYTWIHHPASLELMDIEKEIYGNPNSPQINMICNDLMSIVDTQFDGIFLCRSDTWFPPHLDEYFDKLIGFLVMICSHESSIENSVRVPRDYQHQVNLYKKAQQEMSKFLDREIRPISEGGRV